MKDENKMSWNYRLYRQDVAPLEGLEREPYFYFVGECYYDDKGEPELHSNMDHNLIAGDTPEEVKETYELIAEAFKAPVIELDSEGEFKDGR